MDGIEDVDIACPYCGETITILVDCSAGNQNYIEDCRICCQPMRLVITLDATGTPTVMAAREDDT